MSTQKFPAAGAQPSSWPALMQQLAEAIIAGQPTPGEDWLAHVKVGVAEDVNTLPLITLPMLLVNVNRYGHRRQVLGQWIEELPLPGLSVSAASLIEEWFEILCQNLLAVPGWPLNATSYPGSGRCLTPHWHTAQIIMSQAQGQYALALPSALRQALSPTQVSLIGLLAAAQSGLAGIPLTWRQQWLQCPAPNIGLGHWPQATEQTLWRLADGLYASWAGQPPVISGAPVQGCQSLPITG